MPKSILDVLKGFHDTTMFLTLGLWLCVAPFVVLFTFPFFGWQGSLTAATIAFLIALALCWGVCLFPKSLRDGANRKDRAIPRIDQSPAEVRSNAHRSRVR